MTKGMKSVYLAIAALAVLSLVILACGGDDEDETTPAPAPATVDVSGLTSQLEQTIREEVAKVQPPLSEDQIRSLIENAVIQNAPDTVSSAEIQAMVDSAVAAAAAEGVSQEDVTCLLYTSPSPRDRTRSRMPSSA